jgi:hypothetical protein
MWREDPSKRKRRQNQPRVTVESKLDLQKHND